MADRCTLHVTKLEAFKEWLNDNGMAYRPGKGPFQALQVQTATSGWQVIYSRNDMPEHYTIGDKLTPLVRRFLNESKASKA